MSPSQRSLTIWSPKLTYDDYDTSLMTAGLDMLEIGARQLNDWRLHRLPDVLPFCQPGVPLNTPIFSLTATSSLPTSPLEPNILRFDFTLFVIMPVMVTVRFNLLLLKAGLQTSSPKPLSKNKFYFKK